VRSRQPLPEPSFLDDTLLQYPEKALVAAISELQRVTKLCARSFHLSARVLLFEHSRETVRHIKLNEKVVDEIKLAMRDYLSTMTQRYLSRRQTILIQHLNRCMSDIERIGDHVDEVCDLSLKREKIPEALLDKESLQWLLELYEHADQVLQRVVSSLDPQLPEFQGRAGEVLAARDSYVAKSLAVKADFANKVAEHIVTPIAAMFFTEYVSAFDRVVRHAKTIALAQKQPDFWIKKKKLHRAISEAPDVKPPELADVSDFLERLDKEEGL
jgi:phosphate:Na+ symporter